jgi:hypothetical protein
MQIILTNASQAGMSDTMQSHCRQLLEWRIRKKFTALPRPGDDVTILYSEKDPLMEKDEVDDRAYFIHFTVAKVEGSNNDPDAGDVVIYLDLLY